jgi:hypothetical protein
MIIAGVVKYFRVDFTFILYVRKVIVHLLLWPAVIRYQAGQAADLLTLTLTLTLTSPGSRSMSRVKARASASARQKESQHGMVQS